MPADGGRGTAGTITVAEGMAFSGPGSTIQEALDAGPGGEFPHLVNGVLFRDTDGTVYLATSVSDTTAPTFDKPMLEVLGIDNNGPSWDMANADLLGLEEAPRSSGSSSSRNRPPAPHHERPSVHPAAVRLTGASACASPRLGCSR